VGSAAVTGAFDRRLLGFLALVAVTGVLAMLPRSAGNAQTPPISPPLEVDGWVGTEGAPDDVLPVDERAASGVRRTYRKAGTTVWLAVSHYPAVNGPLARPAFKQIASLRGASAVTRSTMTIHPGDGKGASRSVGLISLAQGKQHGYSVVYWYQLRDNLVVDEYALRLQLLLDGLRMRPRNLVLVRIAVGDAAPPEALVRALLPHLVPA
jgi:EpsI family protein